MAASEASKVADVSPSFWSDVEKGRRFPTRTVLARMCGAVVGDWNEWLIAWADARLGGALDNLRYALAATEPHRHLFRPVGEAKVCDCGLTLNEWAAALAAHRAAVPLRDAPEKP